MAYLLQDKAINKLLKMSMVPVPCQECQLSQNGCTHSESLEWLLDLKDKLPIWSRLNDINTSGYNRKLPMSMSKNYDIEINKRLWSLWGHLRFKNMNKLENTWTGKIYLASTVLALCAARVFSLNEWSSQLMDSIVIHGKQYLKESLKNFTGETKEFQLEDLGCECCLAGIHFQVCIKTVQQGQLYGVPYQGGTNLAFALIQFLAHKQFGILECFNRVLGFGFIAGPEGGYFMFDDQSMNYPLFCKDTSAPYLLRTNHLQILIYCLVKALNNLYKQANFSIHNVEIDVINPNMPSTQKDGCKCRFFKSTQCWNTPSVSSCHTDTNVFNEIAKTEPLIDIVKSPSKKSLTTTIYKRKFNNAEVQKSLVNADRASGEDLKVCHDFVKMICSETVVPLTTAEESDHSGKSFVRQIPDVLVTGV